MIIVENLCKEFVRRQRTGRSLILPMHEERIIPAVKNISFSIKAGECVAFIGPNGAGKSTTLKMLSGILQPTSGSATVAGFIPWESRQKLSHDISFVFGQRSQLWYHLPVRESFELLGKFYRLDNDAYHRQMTRLEENFHLPPLLDTLVKELPLEERMRCEIAASLLHKPKVLFLDEPTVGIDTATKDELRDALCAMVRQDGTTIVLTSHDTADIEKICERVILINHGEKLIDMPLNDSRLHYMHQKNIILTTEEENPTLDIAGTIRMETAPHRLTIEVNPEITPVPLVIGRALQQLTIRDISVQNVSLENVIQRFHSPST